MKDKCIRKMFLFTILFCVFFFLVSVEDACAEDIISKGGSSISETLALPADTSVIEDYAFYGCTSLTGSLNIPASVTSIGNYAFANCTGLTGELTIPDSVNSIGEGAFVGCDGFKKVTGRIILQDGTNVSVKQTIVICSPYSSAWKWAERLDEYRPIDYTELSGRWPKLLEDLIVEKGMWITWPVDEINEFHSEFGFSSPVLDHAYSDQLSMEEAISLVKSYILLNVGVVYPQYYYLNGITPVTMNAEFIDRLKVCAFLTANNEVLNRPNCWNVYLFEDEWLTIALDTFQVQVDARTGDIVSFFEPGGNG